MMGESLLKKKLEKSLNQPKYLQEIGSILKKLLPDLGFCLLIFEFHKPGISDYLSNANREDMIQALFEAAYRLKNQEDWQNKGE